MGDHALSSHLPWYVRGKVTCLQCRVPFVSAPQLERHLQDAHGGRSEEHVQEYMDLIEDLLLFLARYLSRWNPTLEGLLLRARQLQRSGAISIPLNCSSNPLWVRFLEWFVLPMSEAFSMESLNWIPLRAFCTGGSSWPWVLAFQWSSRPSSEHLGFGKGSLELSRHLRRCSLVESLGPLSSLRWLLVRARVFPRPLAALLLCTTERTVWLTHISTSTRWPVLSRSRSCGCQLRHGEGCSWPPGHGALHHPSRVCSWQLRGRRSGESAKDTVSGPEGGDVFRWVPFYGLSVGSGDQG